MKENFLNTKFGKWIYKHQKGITIFTRIILLVAFAILTIGTFIPTSWGFDIPYPLSFIFGNRYHGYTTYYANENLFTDIIRTTIATHHFTDIACMWISYYILCFRTKSFIWPALYSASVISIHEYSWWLSYDIAFTTTTTYNYISKLAIPYAIVIFLYLILKGWNKRETIWLVILWIYYIGWILIGFPVTWGYNGPTIYINNLNIILIEMGSWIWAYATYILIVKPNEIKHRIVN